MLYRMLWKTLITNNLDKIALCSKLLLDFFLANPGYFTDTNIPCSFRSYLVLLSQSSKTIIEKRSLTDQSCTAESVQHTYSSAIANGESCYTTAEILSEKITDEYVFNIGDDQIYREYHNVPLEPGMTYSLYLGVKAAVQVEII